MYLQLALRQVQCDFRQPVVVIAVLGAGVIMAVAGAFATDTALRPVPRGIYWIGIAVSTYALGTGVSAYTRAAWATWHRWLRVATTAMINGLLIAPLIIGLNILVFGPIYDDLREALSFGLTVFAITAMVSVIMDMAVTAIQPQGQSPGQTLSPLLKRLPHAKRGPVLALSAEDHYVRVRTTKGEALILMRLSDAIEETAPTPGLQIHRSHWVALDAVTDATRTGATAVLHLKTGDDIPVSRANIAKAKEAGLLV